MASAMGASEPAALITPLTPLCDQPVAGTAANDTAEMADMITAMRCGLLRAWRRRHIRRLPCLTSTATPYTRQQSKSNSSVAHGCGFDGSAGDDRVDPSRPSAGARPALHAR